MNPTSTITTAAGPEATPQLQPAATRGPALLGSVMVLIQFDVSEEIRLDDVRRLLDARNAAGHWEGRLASSALSTATAVVALSTPAAPTLASSTQPPRMPASANPPSSSA